MLSSKIHMLKLPSPPKKRKKGNFTLQCHSFRRWDSGDTIRLRWGPPLMNGISALINVMRVPIAFSAM